MGHKKWGAFDWIFTIFLIVFFTVALFFAFRMNSEENKINEEFNETIETNNIEIKEIKDNFSNIEELHWTHMPITYKIENECSERQNNLTKLAFRNIENETNALINFKEVSESPDISIYCKPREFIKYADTTLADAIYNISSSNKNIIIKAEINFYGQGMACSTHYPALEVHEILHTFGFMDSPILNKIMSGYSADTSKECKIKEIEIEPLSCLKHIYSNGEIKGNCSRVQSRVCEQGYELSFDDNKCYEECKEGYTRYEDHICYEDCEAGYVLGQDNLCYEECGEDYYCETGSCCGNECILCPVGSYLENDCNCYEDETDIRTTNSILYLEIPTFVPPSFELTPLDA